MKNRDAIAKYIGGYMMQEEEAHEIAGLTESLLEETDLSLYRDENPQIFLLIRCLTSYGTAAILMALALLATICIFILQNKRIIGLVYLGICSVLTGAFNLAATVIAGH